MELLNFLVQMLNAFSNFNLNNKQSDDSIHVENIENLQFDGRRNVRNATTQLDYFIPANVINEQRTSDCDPIILPIGFNKIKLTPRPIGLCEYCCNIKMRKDIRVLLYTKNNPTTAIQLQMRRGNLKRSGLNPAHPTVIFVHGFVEVCLTKSSSYAIRDAYLSRPEPYNVILVDWSNLSAGPWYGQAAENTIIVADMLSKLLKIFHKSGEISMDMVHLIGFSLGAQVVGMTGKFLKGLALVNRITGLDPALPLYPIKDVAHRITKEDAAFVDVIHTTTSLLGYPVSIGHVDFYMNHGRDFQPGCTFEELVLRNQIDDYFSCSHQRAWNAYVETVTNPKIYPGYKCDKEGGNCQFDDVYMGFNVSRSGKGDYYVTTT